MLQVIVMGTGEMLSVRAEDIAARVGALWYGFARVCLAVKG